MKINITKEQKTVNDIASPPLYSISIKREYGSPKSVEWSKDDYLHELNLEDITALAQALSDKFLKI